jgi:hypothetical protein
MSMRALTSILVLTALVACTDEAPTFEELGNEYTMEQEIAASAHLAAPAVAEDLGQTEIDRQLERVGGAVLPTETGAAPAAIPRVEGLSDRIGFDPFDPTQDPCTMALHVGGVAGDTELMGRCRGLDAPAQRCLIPMYRTQNPECGTALEGLASGDRAAFASLLSDLEG